MDFGNLIHKGIMDDNRWIKMPLNKQIGNIGAEVSRLFYWKKQGNTKNADDALDRALELIDLTVFGLQQEHKTTAMREILRFRDESILTTLSFPPVTIPLLRLSGMVTVRPAASTTVSPVGSGLSDPPLFMRTNAAIPAIATIATTATIRIVFFESI